MTQFPVNTHRYDPYKNCKFRVRWDGRSVAGVSRVSPLKRSTEPVTYRSGGDPSTSRVSPSSWRFEPITLERGLTHDHEFEKWANLAYSTDGDAAMSLKGFRREIRIELLNEQGNIVLAWMVFRCWPSEYQAAPELDANGSAIAIESLVLQNEGWERDEGVIEPTET